MKLVFFLAAFSCSLMASSIYLDVGRTETVFNRFSIPNSDDDRVSLPGDSQVTSYRVSGYLDLASGNQLYFLLAPLEISSNFTPSKNFTFNETNFLSGVRTDVEYKFNSYRLGYLWTWNTAKLRYWGGVVAKVRDANIKLSQGSISDNYDNVGLVPLLSFGFDWQLSRGFSLFSHTDALGAAQGSAFDGQMEIKWKTGDYSLSAGKRIFGGGVDNDKVYNFAQFNTYYLRLGYFF